MKAASRSILTVHLKLMEAASLCRCPETHFTKVSHRDPSCLEDVGLGIQPDCSTRARVTSLSHGPHPHPRGPAPCPGWLLTPQVRKLWVPVSTVQPASGRGQTSSGSRT